MADPRRSDPAPAPTKAPNARQFQLSGVPMTAQALERGLYVVATPIGNLEDVTVRALKVLAAADLVYCEDTRITRRLLDRYAIAARPRVYDDHAGPRERASIASEIRAGRSVALVGDAGTPLISDPGFKLVRELREEGLPVHVVPGPSALTAAASVAGLATDRLFFAGFLPAKAGARRRAIADLAAVRATLVLYESPRRLAAALADLAEILDQREAALARELTKINEEVVRGPLERLAERYADSPVRGEVVLLIGPPPPQPADAADIDAALVEQLATSSLRDAVAEVAHRLSLPRAKVYARALELRAGLADDGGDDGAC